MPGYFWWSCSLKPILRAQQLYMLQKPSHHHSRKDAEVAAALGLKEASVRLQIALNIIKAYYQAHISMMPSNLPLSSTCLDFFSLFSRPVAVCLLTSEIG